MLGNNLSKNLSSANDNILVIIKTEFGKVIGGFISGENQSSNFKMRSFLFSATLK